MQTARLKKSSTQVPKQFYKAKEAGKKALIL